jgi:hypothetical protein
MLLNPLEEKLDLPAVAVDIAYFFRSLNFPRFVGQ